MTTSGTVRIGVSGHQGKLGTPIVAAVEQSEDLEIVCTKSRGQAPDVLSGCDVILEVSSADGARETLPWAAANGVNVVCGATGLSAAELDAFDDLFKEFNARCFVVPNFAIGAVLLMHFAAAAAKYFDGVEIIETHHAQKLDAPSGTAKLTAQRIAQALSTKTDNASDEPPARGERVAGVSTHSVRLPGAVAHEEVIFGREGQLLTLRHDSFSRTSFVDGALLALRSFKQLSPGVSVGLDAVLDL